MLMALALAVALGAQEVPAAPGKQKPETPATQPHDGLAVQVALDRAGFSPGILDGRIGGQTKKALEAYRKGNGTEPPAMEPVTTYRITEADVAGPFEKEIPKDLVEQSKLKTLGYRTPLEALAERFHSTPALLERLNPSATFAAGEQITVPNVDPMVLPPPEGKPETKPSAAQKKAEAAAAKAEAGAKPDVTVTVSKSSSALTVTDAAGKVVMYAPVTTGSQMDPLPIGKWKVNGVSLNPPFRYNPDLFWDSDPAHTKALIPPGPNNPVGLVWVDLSKEHYGIHGSPEPANIGRSESHGCVRLTNWDALRLASLVKPGTPVVFRE
jgi:lipoprotein-anchoring transpeptidase ErfK/SrfK